jgi:hypothetical protein
VTRTMAQNTDDWKLGLLIFWLHRSSRRFLDLCPVCNK